MNDISPIADGCSICFSKMDDSGEHVLASLNCGHVFGKSCVEKWVSMSKKCPQCSARATKRHVRRLFPSFSNCGSSSPEMAAICCVSPSEPPELEPPDISFLLRENMELRRKLNELGDLCSKVQDDSEAPRKKNNDSHKIFGRSLLLDHTDDDGLVFISSYSDENDCRTGYVLKGRMEGNVCIGPDNIRNSCSVCMKYEGGPVRCMTKERSGAILFGTTDGYVYLIDHRKNQISLILHILDGGIWSLFFVDDPYCIYAGDTKGRLHKLTDKHESFQIHDSPLHSIQQVSSAFPVLVVGSLSKTSIIPSCSLYPKLTDLNCNMIRPSTCMISSGSIVIVSSRSSGEHPAEHSVLEFNHKFEIKSHSILRGHANSIGMTRGSLSYFTDIPIFVSASETGHYVIWPLKSGYRGVTAKDPIFIPTACPDLLISEITSIVIDGKLVIGSISKGALELKAIELGVI